MTSAPNIGEQSDDGRVAFRRRPHQRGLLPRGFFGIHVRARIKEPSDHLRIARPGRDHQRGLAARGGRVGIGPPSQQRLDDRRAAVRAGQQQWVTPSSLAACTSAPARRSRSTMPAVVLVRSPVQRGRAVALPAVDVDALA